jgi:hypothetical protein
MSKLSLLALAVLAFAGLLAAAPAHAAGAPQAAPLPFLCGANSSPAAPAVGAPAPLPVIINLNCGVCSDTLCHGKKAGATCGAGPAFQGFRCLNDSTCTEDGLQNCTCAIA